MWNRRILVCRLTLCWYPKTLLSELKALEALLIHASTSAVRLQSSLMVLSRCLKLDTTLIESDLGCNVIGMFPGGRTAMVLVFLVLVVRPICWHFSSSDCSMSFKSSHEAVTRVMSSAYSRFHNYVSQLNPLLSTSYASG